MHMSKSSAGRPRECFFDASEVIAIFDRLRNESWTEYCISVKMPWAILEEEGTKTAIHSPLWKIIFHGVFRPRSGVACWQAL